MGFNRFEMYSGVRSFNDLKVIVMAVRNSRPS